MFLRKHCLPRLSFPLLRKHDPAHLKNALEPFTSLDRVLPKSGNDGVFDAVLDSLPAAAHGCYPRTLQKLGLVIPHGPIDHLFLNADQVAECQVLADHGDGFCGGVDVGSFVDHGRLKVAENGFHPLWCGLLAGDETLGAEDAC